MKFDQLVTRSRLASELKAGGLARGDVVLVHTSLSRLGFVPGAARTVIEALIDVVGNNGTVMMPTYSGELSDPAEWRFPPVPESWIQPILNETPAYDPALTPTRRMGVVAELFRHFPGVTRSPHPQSSFSAWGAHAACLVAEHPMDYRFGPKSPLGKLRDLGGKVLLLGAAFQTCSLLYLTQSAMKSSVEVVRKAPVIGMDGKMWVSYRDHEYPNDWFPDACEHLVSVGLMKMSLVGAAQAYVCEAREAIEEVITWRRNAGH